MSPSGTHLVRRVMLPDQIKNGRVRWQVFKPSNVDRTTGTSIFLWPTPPTREELQAWLDVYRRASGFPDELGCCVVSLTEAVRSAVSLHEDAILTPPGGLGERHCNLRSTKPEEGSVAPTRGDIDLLIAALDHGLTLPVT